MRLIMWLCRATWALGTVKGGKVTCEVSEARVHKEHGGPTWAARVHDACGPVQITQATAHQVRLQLAKEGQ